MNRFLEKFQVSIPFRWLHKKYLSRFIEKHINPEIGFDSYTFENYSGSDFIGIAKQLQQNGLSITLHAPFMDLSPGSPDRDIRVLTHHRFEQMLEMVKIFKPKSLVCHAGYDNKRYWHIKESWVEKSVETWKWLGKAVKETGTMLMLENVYERSPKELLMLFDKLYEDSIGFCLDCGHQAVFGRVSLEEWITSMRPLTKQIHLHDNLGEFDDHFALGHGCIDFMGFLERLVYRFINIFTNKIDSGILISKTTGGNQYATEKPESKVDFGPGEERAITTDC